MASSLIEKLNAFATLTPDEIVKKLTNSGFYHAFSLTEEQYDALRQTRVYFWNCESRSWEGRRNPGTPKRIGGSWSNFRSWTSNFNSSYMRKWWFIPVEDYKENMSCPSSSDCPPSPT